MLVSKDIVSQTPTGKSKRVGTQLWVQYEIIEWVWSPCLQVYRKVTELWWCVEEW